MNSKKLMKGLMMSHFYVSTRIICYYFSIILLLFPFICIKYEYIEHQTQILYVKSQNECKDENISVGRSYYEEINEIEIEISLCTFKRLNVFEDSLGGGCIFINDAQALISQCTFFNCQVLTQGGAIRSILGNITFDKLCGFMCLAHEGGQFSFLSEGSARTNYSTISMSEYDGEFSCSLGYSDISDFESFYNNNLSHNNLFVTVLEMVSSTVSSIKYINICNNTLSNGICCDINFGNSKMTFVNFVSIHSPGYGVLFVSNGAIGSIINCIFLDNTGKLFYSTGGIFYVHGCFIDHSGEKFVGSTFDLENNSYNVFSTYKIVHYYADYCPTGIHDPDPTFDMTPIMSRTFDQTLPPTIDKTMKKTPIETPYITQSIDQTLKETPEGTFHETPVETPILTHTLDQTLKETNDKTLSETPVVTPYLSQTLNETPFDTIEETPCKTPHISPTFDQTPNDSIAETPCKSPHISPTFDQTPKNSIAETPCESIVLMTPHISPSKMNTPEFSIVLTATLMSTPISLPIETSTSESIVSKGIIILIGSVSILTILIGAGYMFRFYRMDYFEDNSDHCQSFENDAV